MGAQAFRYSCFAFLIFLCACGDNDAVLDEIETLDGRVAIGQQLYETNCLGCHGTLREGLSGPGIAADDLLNRSDRYLARQILFGDGRMPLFEKEFSTQDVADLIAFLRSE